MYEVNLYIPLDASQITNEAATSKLFRRNTVLVLIPVFRRKLGEACNVAAETEIEVRLEVK